MTDEPTRDAARRRRVRPARSPQQPEPAEPPQAPSRTKAERDAERGLRNLVGAGPTQVSTAAAMRARDASRPTDEELAAAERSVVVVRRHYVPADTTPFTGQSERR